MQCFCLDPQPHCHPNSRGCGDTIISSGAGTDAGGNKVLADVGAWASWAGYEPAEFQLIVETFTIWLFVTLYLIFNR